MQSTLPGLLQHPETQQFDQRALQRVFGTPAPFTHP